MKLIVLFICYIISTHKAKTRYSRIHSVVRPSRHTVVAGLS